MSLDPALAAHAVASAGDAIVTVDSTGTMTSWNHAAERLFEFVSVEGLR
jgi:PAS domain-containing protein